MNRTAELLDDVKMELIRLQEERDWLIRKLTQEGQRAWLREFDMFRIELDTTYPFENVYKFMKEYPKEPVVSDGSLEYVVDDET